MGAIFMGNSPFVNGEPLKSPRRSAADDPRARLRGLGRWDVFSPAGIMKLKKVRGA
jgi:hypothetical protein